jgi:hypothetical protein
MLRAFLCIGKFRFIALFTVFIATLALFMYFAPQYVFVNLYMKADAPVDVSIVCSSQDAKEGAGKAFRRQFSYSKVGTYQRCKFVCPIAKLKCMRLEFSGGAKRVQLEHITFCRLPFMKYRVNCYDIQKIAKVDASLPTQCDSESFNITPSGIGNAPVSLEIFPEDGKLIHDRAFTVVQSLLFIALTLIALAVAGHWKELEGAFVSLRKAGLGGLVSRTKRLAV